MVSWRLNQKQHLTLRLQPQRRLGLNTHYLLSVAIRAQGFDARVLTRVTDWSKLSCRLDNATKQQPRSSARQLFADHLD